MLFPLRLNYTKYFNPLETANLLLSNAPNRIYLNRSTNGGDIRSKVTCFNLCFLSLVYFQKLRYVKFWPAWQWSVRMRRAVQTV